MIAIVLLLNGVLAFLCLYMAWQLCRLRSVLAKAADVLTLANHTTHRVLCNAPVAIGSGQMGSFQLRQRYRLLILQLQQVQQVLSLLGLGQWVWRYYVNRQARYHTGYYARHKVDSCTSARSRQKRVHHSKYSHDMRLSDPPRPNPPFPHLDEEGVREAGLGIKAMQDSSTSVRKLPIA
ncbi:hypothetical protein [Thermocoleostomius sinensis]|uniref:Uncharacterized protein n=1 Tax=Thermocoleostomius sinensis A174 TaxID=2016057 RepID=A0A9E8ZHN7_9CYAN|nr:hypothetical protein [Thermocoleostomius sinensis]WAL61395.1 hypothetical protein OXH18_05230 [Thermocoleostomius sinensis A174]